MKKYFFALLATLCVYTANTQAITQLRGTVFHRAADNKHKKPVGHGTAILVAGVGSCTTDNNGSYALNLIGCPQCTPGTTLTLKVNSSFGWTEKEVVLSKDPLQSTDIEIIENSQLLLTGTVRAKHDQHFLSKIKVRPLLQNVPAFQSDNTDEDGVFQILINKEGVTDQQAIELIISDPSKHYKDVRMPVFINRYQPIEVELELAGLSQDPVGSARALATAEVLTNIKNLDSRLAFTAHSLKMKEVDSFPLAFESIMRRVVPIEPDPKSNLNNLMLRSDMASLKSTLNSVPLEDNFGQALAQVFITANLQEEPNAVQQYLDEFKEVEWAEKTLFDAWETLANAQDTFCDATMRERVLLGWATIRNRAMQYHAHALRLLHVLKTEPTAMAATFGNLKRLTPKRPLSEQELNQMLLSLTVEMTKIMLKRAEIVERLTRCRDERLHGGFAKIDSTLKVRLGDSWQEVIIKARVLRDLGRWEEAEDAFVKYGEMFGGQDTVAAPYSIMAIRFTRQLTALKVKGGVYLYSYAESSHIKDAGVCLGDILVSLQGQPVVGMDEVHKIFLGLEANTPVSLETLRWDEKKQNFARLKFTIPSKPMGGVFMPI